MNKDLEKLLFEELEQYCRCQSRVCRIRDVKAAVQHATLDAILPCELPECGHRTAKDGMGGFLPAVKQIANVAGLPGIVKVS